MVSEFNKKKKKSTFCVTSTLLHATAQNQKDPPDATLSLTLLCTGGHTKETCITDPCGPAGTSEHTGCCDVRPIKCYQKLCTGLIAAVGIVNTLSPSSDECKTPATVIVILARASRIDPRPQRQNTAAVRERECRGGSLCMFCCFGRFEAKGCKHSNPD